MLVLYVVDGGLMMDVPLFRSTNASRILYRLT
jgi:hypothetical protein